MKALSIKPPWVNMIVRGLKTIETRTWPTTYRGPLLLVTSKTVDKDAPWPQVPDLPLGYAVATCQLVDCRAMGAGDYVQARCPWGYGLYSWILTDIKSIVPFSVRGRLGLYEIEVPHD